MKLTFILFLAGIPAVFAQQSPTVTATPAVPSSTVSESLMRRFQKIDKDGDGRVSLSEFQAKGKDPAQRAKRFHKLDTNHDGYLSADEFAAGTPAKSR